MIEPVPVPDLARRRERFVRRDRDIPYSTRRVGDATARLVLRDFGGRHLAAI
ncbi:hypothetical protein ACFX5Q_13685 [Mesorhizobium sp. IMUNJ 23033]|uniref:hypothetical protein n=1 Tax=Mesorhizobium sp. IMUNJ 23033 TaxID=3378039 RepID=UPI00384E544F